MRESTSPPQRSDHRRSSSYSAKFKSRPARYRHAAIFRTLFIFFVGIVIFGTFALYHIWNYLGDVHASEKARGGRDHLFLTRRPARFHGRVPIVDRPILQNIDARLRYLAGKDDLDNFQEWTAPPNPNSPPKVTDIPQPRRPKSPKIDHFILPQLLPNDVADAKICGPLPFPCRLLVPVWIGEQESKAQKHLHQLGLLARSLNRTLVLPNLSRSRLGTCYNYPFGLYFEDNVMDQLGIPAVTFVDFKDWVAQRMDAPTAQIVAVEHLTTDDTLEPIVWTDSSSKDPSKGKRNHCLEDLTPRLSFREFLPMSIRPGVSKWHKSSAAILSFHEILINKLRDPTEIAQGSIQVPPARVPDVLAVTWELRHPVFPISSSAPPHLPYASRWTSAAASICTRLSPFIAVHWRMETLPPTVLPECAHDLIRTILSLAKLHQFEDDNIRTVYLATDYPLQGPESPHSGTFKEVNKHHHRAISVLKNAFNDGELSGLVLTSLSEQLSQGRNQHGVDLQGMDPGLMAILDKTVSGCAELFVSGSKECGRQSSFTAQIISERRRNDVRSEVAYFGPKTTS